MLFVVEELARFTQLDIKIQLDLKIPRALALGVGFSAAQDAMVRTVIRSQRRQTRRTV